MQETKSAMTQINAASFDLEVLGEKRIVLVDVSTPWCPPCRMMTPIVEKIAAAYPDRVKVCAVDTSEDIELGRRLNISVVPTFFVYRSGEVVEKFQGAVSERVLLSKLGLST